MVIIKCDLDEYVVSQTGIDSFQFHHVAGKGKVINKINRNPDNNAGTIDKDPDSPQPGKLKEYSEITKNGSLTLLQHDELNELKLIVVDPRIEEWLIERATVNSIDITTYGYSNDAEKLHDIPKIEQQSKFQEFLKDLFNVDEEFSILQNWVLEFGP